MGYTATNLDEIERGGRTGRVRFVRKALALKAFGLNWFELGPGEEGHEHDEVDTGQEEVALVLEGDGHWRVDGEAVPVRTGSLIRFDPTSTRCPVAGPNGLAFLIAGAAPGCYTPTEPF